MKRADLEKQIKAMAKKAGVTPTTREGGNHFIYEFPGARPIGVPRHREIGEHLAEKILKQVKAALGSR